MYPRVNDLAVFATSPGTLQLGTVTRVWDRPAADPYVTVRTCEQPGRTFVRSVSTVTVISLSALAAALAGQLAAAAAEHGDPGPDGTPQLQCCGVWIDYPAPGRTTSCPECRSVFALPAHVTVPA